MESFLRKALLVVLSITISLNVTSSGNSTGNNSASKQPHVNRHAAKVNDFLVKFRQGVTAADAASLVNQHGAKNLQRLSRSQGQRANERWHRVTLPPGVQRKMVMERLRTNPKIEQIEPNYLLPIILGQPYNAR